jgi:hypothetical protein
MKILRPLFLAVLASLALVACSGAPGQSGQGYSPVVICNGGG